MSESRDTADLIKRIKAGPHWRVVIRPEVFVAEWIRTLSECWRFVESSRVSLRGWDYPHVEHRNRENGNEWVQSWSDFGSHREFWRFYQSGQFVHLFSFTEDEKREDAEKIARAEIREMPQDFSPSGYLDVISALWTITEIFEFAARLAEKEVFGTSASVEIQMIGVKHRILFTWDQSRAWWRFYVAQEDILGREWPLATNQLLSESSMLALDAAEWFFERFQWTDPSREVLANEQKRLLEKRF